MLTSLSVSFCVAASAASLVTYVGRYQVRDISLGLISRPNNNFDLTDTSIIHRSRNRVDIALRVSAETLYI